MEPPGYYDNHQKWQEPEPDNVSKRHNHHENFNAAPLSHQPSPYSNKFAYNPPPPSEQQQHHPQYQGGPFPNEFMAAEPMMNFAKAYGGHIAEQSKQQIEKYVAITKLKYYFDVDNSYVGKKLALLLFPFFHKEWSVKYSQREEPVSPRYDVNAPDLYIPTMAIVTYILLAGLVLGTQDRFSPEKLGIYASSALMWLLCENVVVLFMKYVMNISQSLRTWDTLAFCGYKYICMNVCLIVYLFFDKFAYYCVFGYCSLAIVFFLIRSVRGIVLENFAGSDGRKRKLYLLLFISLSQPFVVWWLTSSLTAYHKTAVKFILPDDFELEVTSS